jgi:branched-chain amino acid transport system substrate-binding protein
LATTNMKVAAFATDEPDGRGWYMSITPLMKEQGFDVYKVDKEFGLVPLETTDFSTLIKEWKDAGCESLWSNSPGPVFATLWKQAMAKGYKPKDAFATRAAVFYDDIMSWGGDLAHGVSNEMFWNPGIKSSKGIGGTTPQSLADRYVKDTNLGYSQNLGFGYAAVQVLADAIHRAGSIDPEKVNAAIKTTDLVTMDSRVAFDKDNYSRVPVAFGQWISVDKPYKYENPVVLSVNDDLAATAEWEFPIKYKQ